MQLFSRSIKLESVKYLKALQSFGAKQFAFGYSDYLDFNTCNESSVQPESGREIEKIKTKLCWQKCFHDCFHTAQKCVLKSHCLILYKIKI